MGLLTSFYLIKNFKKSLMSQVHSVQLSAEAMPFGQGYTNLAKKNQVGVPTTLTEALTVADLQGVLLQVQKLSQAIV